MRDIKYSLGWLLKTKADIMKMLEKSRIDLEQAKLDVGIWEMMVNDVDAEIAEIQKKQREDRGNLSMGIEPVIKKAGSNFNMDITWKCCECGYTCEGKRPEECPKCGYDLFESVDNDELKEWD